MTYRSLLLTCVLASTLAACGGGGGKIPPSGPVEVPANPDDQWTLVSPASVGMDAATLNQAPALVDSSNTGVSALLVMRHGQPVMERYWNGYGKDTLHDMRSATKSITSLLVGMAIDEHDLGGVDDTLAQWLSTDYPGAPALAHGTVLKNLLMMQGGLDCNDWNNASPGNEENMYDAQDWVKFYLELAGKYPPGTVTVYCTGNPVTLGHVLRNATHQSVATFAQSHLFGPLGITSARWNTYDNGTEIDTGGHMQMRPRDMARIGQFALQRGMWNGTQRVSSAWIDVSTSRLGAFDSDPADGYGYLWWHSTDRRGLTSVQTFYANGAGGQFIFVCPELDLVVVMTGENYDNEPAVQRAHQFYDSFILPAVNAGS